MTSNETGHARWPPAPPSVPYVFHGTDSWRPDDDRSAHRHDFSFRNDHVAPPYPRGVDRYETGSFKDSTTRTSGQRGLDHQQDRERSQRRRPSARRGGFNGNIRGGRGNRFATASRPLLSTKQGSLPEQVLGSADDPHAIKRFLLADDMTDSEEEEMVESDSEKDQNLEDPNVIEGGTSGLTERTAEVSIEQPAKRRALESKRSTKEAQIPRWSNPDPYTSLPPIDESQRKRKDVVKIIRKARIVIDKEADAPNQAAANDDFISFGFDEGIVASEENIEEGSTIIPQGPSSFHEFSHLQNLHNGSSPRAPGTREMTGTAGINGPPPGLASTSRLDGNATTLVDIDSYANEALGSRKRTHDDIITSTIQRPAKSKRGFMESSSGSLTEEWLPNGDTNRTPWLTQSCSYQSKNQGFRLHKEICDFYEFVRPRRFEEEVRQDLLKRLQSIVKKQFYRCEVYCFGSFAAGLYLPNGDMDVVVLSEEFRAGGPAIAGRSKSSMHKFGAYLENSGFAEQDSVEVIPSAKVPLIKFVDRVTGVRVDLSFENHTGLTANDTFDIWKSQFPAMPIIVTVIKQFLLMRGLNEVVNGGLGGFAVTCLVTSMLQNMPRVQSGELVPEQHLGEILIEFLDLYGNQFDISRTGIRMDPPGYFDKNEYARYMSRKSVYQANKSDRLAILDPNKPDNDISGGSRNVMLIFDCFSLAHMEIMKAMKSSDSKSLFEWTLGGDYEVYLSQRNHLQRLHKESLGSSKVDEVDFQYHSLAQLRVKAPPHRPTDNLNGDHNIIYGQNENEARSLQNPSSLNTKNFKEKSSRKLRKSPNPVYRKFVQKLTTPNPNLANPSPSSLHPPKEKRPKRQPKLKQDLDPLAKMKNRAARLKAQYPQIKTIPDTLTKSGRTRLLEQIKLDHPQIRPVRKVAKAMTAAAAINAASTSAGVDQLRRRKPRKAKARRRGEITPHVDSYPAGTELPSKIP